MAVSGLTLADDPLPASQFPLLVQDGPIFFGVRPDSFVEPNPAQFVFTQKAKVAPVAGVPLTPVGPVPAVVPAPLVGPVPSVAPVPAPGPIFVPAPVVVATAPAPRPTGTFVFFGRPTAAPATTAAPSGLAVDLGLAGDAVPKPANAFDIRLVALEEGDIVDSLMLFTVDEP